MRQVITEIRNDKKLIFLIVAIITAGEFITVVPFMFTNSNEYTDYYVTTLPRAFACDLDEFPDNRSPIKWYLHCLSFQLTGYANAFLIPFAPACLPLAYLLGYYMTNDRLIGLLTISALIYNPLYKDWTTTGTYDQVWTFFILLSLVLLFRNKTVASFGSYIVAAFAKSFSLAFFPMWLYTIYEVKKNRDYLIVFLLIGGLGLSMILYFGLVEKLVGSPVGFYSENTDQAIVDNIGLFWKIIPALAIVASLNLQFKTQAKIPNMRLVGIWLTSFFIMTPLIHLFSMQGTYGYRYVLLGVFMSILIGMTIVKLGNWYVEKKLMPSTKSAY